MHTRSWPWKYQRLPGELIQRRSTDIDHGHECEGLNNTDGVVNEHVDAQCHAGDEARSEEQHHRVDHLVHVKLAEQAHLLHAELLDALCQESSHA